MTSCLTPDLALGVEEIDSQHRAGATNALHDEISSASPHRETIYWFWRAGGLHANHFVVEEVLFQQHRCLETSAHQAQHNRFTEKPFDLLRFEDGEEVSTEALDFQRLVGAPPFAVDRAPVFFQEVFRHARAKALAA